METQDDRLRPAANLVRHRSLLLPKKSQYWNHASYILTLLDQLRPIVITWSELNTSPVSGAQTQFSQNYLDDSLECASGIKRAKNSSYCFEGGKRAKNIYSRALFFGGTWSGLSGRSIARACLLPRAVSRVSHFSPARLRLATTVSALSHPMHHLPSQWLSPESRVLAHRILTTRREACMYIISNLFLLLSEYRQPPRG